MDTYDIPLTITCDLGKNTATPQVISINQNEANVKKLRVEFVSGGKSWEIPDGFSCNILMKKADGFAIDNPAESISGNAAIFNVTPQMTAAAGENYFQIQVVKSEDDTRGFAAVLYVQRAVLADDDIISEDEKETINGLIDRAENAVQEAEGAVDDAQSAVNNAQSAVKNANSAVDKANQAVQDAQDAIDQIIEASGNLINDNKLSDTTTYSSNKINNDFRKNTDIIDVAHGGTGAQNASKALQNLGGFPLVKNKIDVYGDGDGVAFGKSAEEGAVVDCGWKIKNRLPLILDVNSGIVVVTSDTGETIPALAQGPTGNIVIGYGNYERKKGSTNIYGEDVYLFSSYVPDVSLRPYFRAGDSITTVLHTAGYITTSGTVLYFTVPIDRPLMGVSVITASSVEGFIVRQDNKYLYGSDSDVYAKPNSYVAYYRNCLIEIAATFSNTTNVINNAPVGIHWSGKLTFS